MSNDDFYSGQRLKRGNPRQRPPRPHKVGDPYSEVVSKVRGGYMGVIKFNEELNEYGFYPKPRIRLVFNSQCMTIINNEIKTLNHLVKSK